MSDQSYSRNPPLNVPRSMLNLIEDSAHPFPGMEAAGMARFASTIAIDLCHTCGLALLIYWIVP